MSSDVAIRVDNLSKCYEIYETPRDRLKQFVYPKVRQALGVVGSNKYYREFWALRDVSFEVKRGETLGVLGCNGSGKSTLLQMICGTLTPTSGGVITSGRVAALLELGSGFNPDFTGRENVFMNAAILGLSQTEIAGKFEDIAEFADIGDFIDQPVKTYSSGMFVRLAFSVQIMVDPDILIIDEALSVGDARFQLKCFQRLEQIKHNGTTIIFVTHSIEQIRTFCDKGLVLNEGRSFYYGDAKTAAVKYYQVIFPEKEGQQSLLDDPDEPVNEGLGCSDHESYKLASEACASITPAEDSYSLVVNPDSSVNKCFGVGGAKIDWIKIYGLTDPNVFLGGEKIRIQCQYTWERDFINKLINENNLNNDVSLGVALADEKGQYIFGCNGYDANFFVNCNDLSSSAVEFEFVLPYLKSGNYFLTLAVSVGTMQNHIQLKWYDYLVELKCVSIKENVYGICHLDYSMKRID